MLFFVINDAERKQLH